METEDNRYAWKDAGANVEISVEDHEHEDEEGKTHYHILLYSLIYYCTGKMHLLGSDLKLEVTFKTLPDLT